MSNPTAHHTHETAPMHDPVDSWHDHTADEKPQQAHAEVGNAAAITGIGIALFLLIVVAVVAVYAYYTWFITERLRRAEIATSSLSPAIQAREYKSQSLIRLANGGTNLTAPAFADFPELKFSLSPIDQKIESVVQQYSPAK